MPGSRCSARRCSSSRARAAFRSALFCAVSSAARGAVRRARRVARCAAWEVWRAAGRSGAAWGLLRCSASRARAAFRSAFFRAVSAATRNAVRRARRSASYAFFGVLPSTTKAAASVGFAWGLLRCRAPAPSCSTARFRRKLASFNTRWWAVMRRSCSETCTQDRSAETPALCVWRPLHSIPSCQQHGSNIRTLCGSALGMPGTSRRHDCTLSEQSQGATGSTKYSRPGRWGDDSS